MAHVLIVDDDADIRMSMRALLEDIGGHTVDEAANGASGLEHLRASQEPLVVLLDLLMPGMDGLQVLQTVAADEDLATRHAYVLVSVSRRATIEEVPRSMALAVTIVPKPFDIDVLLATVSDADERIHEQTPPRRPPRQT